MDAIYIIALFLVCIASLSMFVFVLNITIIGDIKGAPFTKSSPVEIQTMLNFAAIRKNELVFDLGSGDGTILIEAAKRGANAIGTELNPFLVWYSQLRVKHSGYSDKVSIRWGNLKKISLKDADVLFFYLLPNTVRNLKEKFSRELKVNARIISNGIPISGWTPIREKNNVFLYRKVNGYNS